MAGSGLTMMAGIKTLDTSIIGAIIISGIVTALHNRLFDKKLPVFLGIFQGTSYVVIIAFLVMILRLADVARLAKSTNGD